MTGTHRFDGLHLRHGRLVARFHRDADNDTRLIPIGAGSLWAPMSSEEEPLADLAAHRDLVERSAEWHAAIESIAIVDRFKRGEHHHRSYNRQHPINRGRAA